MSLETQLEAEKAALRAEIRQRWAFYERAVDRLMAEAIDSEEDAIARQYVIGQYHERLLPPIAYLEHRLFDLETTVQIDGLWYKMRPDAPGEARLILDRSLSQGMADAAAPGETQRSAPGPASL